MKKNFYLALKVAISTFFALSNLILMLNILNAGRGKIYGREVFICFKHNAIYLRDGRKKYSIELDKNKLTNIINFIYQHPGVLPVPFNFIVYGSSLASSFF